MSIQSLAVFCGSLPGKKPQFTTHAAQLGKIIALHGVKLIYGGGKAGLMGTVADAVLENGGQVLGIIPNLLAQKEKQHDGITQLIKTANMHERKKMLYNYCDAAIILPGGFGTLDELFEIITWNQLDIHNKQIFILNSLGFYSHLLQHISHMQQNGFLHNDSVDKITVLYEVSEIEKYL